MSTTDNNHSNDYDQTIKIQLRELISDLKDHNDDILYVQNFIDNLLSFNDIFTAMSIYFNECLDSNEDLSTYLISKTNMFVKQLEKYIEEHIQNSNVLIGIIMCLPLEKQEKYQNLINPVTSQTQSFTTGIQCSSLLKKKLLSYIESKDNQNIKETISNLLNLLNKK